MRVVNLVGTELLHLTRPHFNSISLVTVVRIDIHTVVRVVPPLHKHGSQRVEHSVKLKRVRVRTDEDLRMYGFTPTEGTVSKVHGRMLVDPLEVEQEAGDEDACYPADWVSTSKRRRGEARREVRTAQRRWWPR